jgi:hypothetical protein
LASGTRASALEIPILLHARGLLPGGTASGPGTAAPSERPALRVYLRSLEEQCAGSASCAKSARSSATPRPGSPRRPRRSRPGIRVHESQPGRAAPRHHVPIPPCSPSPQRRPSLPPDDTPVRGRLNQECGYFDAAVEHLGASPSSPRRRRGEEGGAGASIVHRGLELAVRCLPRRFPRAASPSGGRKAHGREAPGRIQESWYGRLGAAGPRA